MKKKHNVAFHLVMLMMILVATTLVFYRALVHLRDQIDDIKINSVYRVRQIGEDFEMLLAGNEEAMKQELTQKLPALKQQLIDNRNAQYADLDAIALNQGVDLILLAEAEGLIKGSTDMKLKGENLSNLITDYDKVIALTKENDGLFVDRIGLLTNSQSLYKTAWFLSEDEEHILVYGIEMSDYLTKTNSQSFADYLLGGYFKNISGSILLVSKIDLCFHQNGFHHSYWGNECQDLANPAQMYGSIESQIINNYESVIIPIVQKNSSGICKPYLKISFDNEMIRQISLNLLFRALFGFVLLSLVIYLIVYFFFRSIRTDREENMLDIISAIRKKQFSPDMIEKGIFKLEIEKGICELAEKLNQEKPPLIKSDPQDKELIEKLRLQLESDQKQIDSLATELNEERQMNERMRRSDQVTGLPNREVLMEHLEYEAARADREKNDFSLLIIKLNNLKQLNNAFGHNFSDYILNKTGSKLRALLRKQDRIGRWEQDQFLLILPVTGSIGIRQLIAKLDECIQQIDFNQNGNIVKLNILFGGVIYKPGMNSQNCLRQVQVAVQEAEHSGRHTIIE